jgi:preprotein translocase subunit SecA
MKTNSINSLQGEGYRDKLLKLREFMNQGILTKLDQNEYTNQSTYEVGLTLKTARTCLHKNNLNDEIIVKIEDLLVSKGDRHRACHKQYYDFLKEVQTSGKYTSFKPSTLEIINNQPKPPVVANEPVTKQLDFTKIMEMGVAQVEKQTKHSSVEFLEIEKILGKIRSINSDPKILELASNYGVIKDCYTKIKKAEYKDSAIFHQGPAIANWQLEHISNWAKQMHEHKDIANNPKMLPEIIAVISKAVSLHAKHSPRDVQLVSLITTALNNDKGKLLQISTGEGKSTTTAMLGTLKGLQGKNVDIITSSQVLATRDAGEWESFYNIFGLSCSHNIEQAKNKGAKECYKANIVYGDSLHFQSDLIRDQHKLQGTRGARDFTNSVALIDEVDSMLIDESGKIAKLASPSPSMEYLAPIFVTSFHYLTQVVNYFQEQGEEYSDIFNNRSEWLEQNVTGYIKKLVGLDHGISDIEQLSLPPHLQDFTRGQPEVWSKSAINAFTMQEKRDYLVREVDGKKVIAPIDYASTGVIQERTHWSNGLHQYLQVKHNLAMTPEGLTTSFMSNLSYFKRYGANIIGMSGTLGSMAEQELLKRTYDVDIAFIPTFTEKKFKELPAIITDSTKKQYQAIAEVAKDIGNDKRASLILAETIHDVENIKEYLLSNGIEDKSIKTYTTGSEEENARVIKDLVYPNDVIIATNLAGRGTDIKLGTNVKARGGLHVILSFLPANLRVEEQAYGRCARGGEAGSGQMILNGTYESLKLYGTHIDKQTDNSNEIDILKTRRNLAETLRLKDIEKKLIPKIELEDQLFSRYSAQAHELQKLEDNTYKQTQLEELWGLWFKDISNHLDKVKDEGFDKDKILSSQEEFLAKVKNGYTNGNIMQNPAYLNQEAVNNFGKHNSYDNSVDILEKAASLAGNYGFATSYNLAYCYFRQNAEHPSKNDPRLLNGGIDHLSKSLSQLEGVIIPQLHMMQILVGDANKSSDLSMQISTKINLHKMQSEYIRNALQKIEQGVGQGKVIVVNSRDTRPVFELVGQTPTTASEEVLELARQGVVQNYVLDAKDPPKDMLGAIGVGILGVSQFIVGALVTVASAGAATSMGVSMMVSGAQDLYRGVRAAMGKEVINWKEYWTNKGISYAISAISMGWDNFKAGLSAIKEQVGRIAEASKNFFTGTASNIMGRQAVSEFAKSSITEGTKEASKTTFTSIASDFIAKEGMSKVVMEVSKSIAIQNVTNIAAKEIAKSLEVEKEDIREDAYNQIMQTLTSEPASSHINHLLAIDEINGNHFYANRIKQDAYKLLTPKADKISSLARKITSAAMSGMASRSGSMGAVIAIGTMSTVTEIAEANKQIKNLVEDFCGELKESITNTYHEANSTVPSLMYKLMPQYTIKQEEIGEVIDILATNQVLDTTTMQFNHKYLQPMVSFEAGLLFDKPLPEPQVENPIYHFGQIVNKPPQAKIHAFQMEELKKNAPSDPKNIEEIDFGPFRGVRDRIIKVSRHISEKQADNKQKEKQALAEEMANRAADRTVGIIRHNIISPVIAPAIGFGVNQLTKGFMDVVTKKPESKSIIGVSDPLERKFLADNLARAGFSGIGVSAGDEEDPKKQNQDKEQKRKTLDLSPDTVFLNKLASLFEMDQDSEVARMLKGLRESQEEPKTVPIYDSSNKPHLIPKTNTGLSLVNTANANPTNAIATTISSELPLLEFSLFTGSAISSGSINVSRLMGETISMARAFPQAALITGGIVGTGMALNQASQFEAQHPWITADSTETLLDPWTTPEDANAQWQQMRNDPILGITNTGNNATINMPIMQTSTSSLLNDIRMDIDPNANKPSIESFPAVYKPKSILFTPDDRSTLLDLGKLGGFMPSSYTQPMVESFPITEIEYENLISLKEGDHSIKSRLKDQQLPTEGKIRFVPDERYNPNIPLQKGINHGYYDRFGNEWTKGPSRTEGEPFEWDVQLSETGKAQLGHLSRDGKHINVSLKGRITHK